MKRIALILLLFASSAWAAAPLPPQPNASDTPAAGGGHVCKADATLRVAMVLGNDPFTCKLLLRSRDAEQQDFERINMLPELAPDSVVTVCWEATGTPASTFKVFTDAADHSKPFYRSHVVVPFPDGCGGLFTVFAYDSRIKDCTDERVVSFEINAEEPEICADWF